MKKFMTFAVALTVITIFTPEAMANYNISTAKTDSQYNYDSAEYVSATTNIAAHPKRKQSSTRLYEPGDINIM